MEALVFKGNAGQALTSSLLVAKKFGKEHKRVMQDVRELGCSEKFRQHNFVLSTYLSSQNKELPMYIITKDGFTLLVMGYTGEVAMSFKEDYIAAFNQMEKELKESRILSEPKQAKSVSPRTIQLMKLDTANWLIKNLKYSDTAKLALAKVIADPLELPVPVYAKSKGIIHSATEILNERNIPLSAQKFNKIMIQAGMLERASRYSKSKRKYITWPVLVGDGLIYGENGIHPDNPRETQPSYYDDKFNDLLIRLGIDNKTK